MMKNKILLIDDEKSIVKTLAYELEDQGYTVDCASCLQDGIGYLRADDYLAVITDIRLPDGSGIDLLEPIKRDRPETEVVVITGYGTIESAISALKAGAFDYILKPFYNEELISIINKIREIYCLKNENASLKDTIEQRTRLDRMLGKSKKMQDIFNLIRTVSQSEANVLITGESGTGKELVAEAIHKMSPRSDKPMIRMNCEVFSASLLESELFGHEKGAFTGAAKQKPGRFELANGGTLFLDDIDDLDPRIQVKLLRAIQERTFERIGGTQTIKVDIRLISASKTDLRIASAEGNFRKDLFYRLNVVPIKLPPLRERREDLPMLIDHFLSMYSNDIPRQVDSDAMNALLAYDWPGNVRELENTIEGTLAVAGTSDSITIDHITNEVIRPVQADTPAVDSSSLALEDVMHQHERQHLESILSMTNGKRTKAAEILQISRKSLWQKLKQYNIDADQ